MCVLASVVRQCCGTGVRNAPGHGESHRRLPLSGPPQPLCLRCSGIVVGLSLCVCAGFGGVGLAACLLSSSVVGLVVVRVGFGERWACMGIAFQPVGGGVWAMLALIWRLLCLPRLRGSDLGAFGYRHLLAMRVCLQWCCVSGRHAVRVNTASFTSAWLVSVWG